MRRVLVVIGSVAVIAAVVFGALRFTATDDTIGSTAAGVRSDGTSSTTTAATNGATTGGDAGEPPSTTLATRDGSLDASLGGYLVTPAEYGEGFNPVGPTPEETTTRCGSPGIDDPIGSQGRAMIGMERTAGTLAVVQSVRAYPDAQAAAGAYNASVSSINCPLVELADGTYPTPTGSEVGGLGADQSYAVDYLPDPAAAAPVPIGGGFVARVGARVLTLRYVVDPADPAAAGYDLSAVVRLAISKLAAG